MNRKITRKLIIYVSPIIIFLFAYTAVNLYLDLNNTTPQMAVKKRHPFKAQEILHTFEQDDVALVLYNGPAGINQACLIKWKFGWRATRNEEKVIVNTVVGKQKHIVFIRKVRNKYIVNVTDVYRHPPKQISVTDSLNSSFECVEKKLDDVTSYDWVMITDDLPKGYTIHIGDDTFQLPD